MIICISSDHAGYDLKKLVADHLTELGHEVILAGATSGDVPFSYVEAGQACAEDVLSGKVDRGIVICGTGLGISMTANKYKGIRCALCTDEFMARMSRQHNDANVLAMGARVIGKGLAFSITDAFLTEEFAGGRHAERVNDIKAQEEKLFK